MTDQELLEKAAKAAGIDGMYYFADGVLADGIGYNDELDCFRWWNPLVDYGHALQLAVKLEMRVTVIGDGMAEAKTEAGETWFEHESDTGTATCRAIVRCAAAIADAPGAA